MDKLTIDDFKKMLRNALVCITERSDEFSKLDAVLGDGDHGTAIVQSMSALVATADKGTEFKSMLNDMSFNLMLEISGSTSTLLGGFFLGMSDHAEGKIGVLVDVETDVVNDEIKEMAKNVAMQAAALKPLYTNDSEVDADYIAKEKEILTVAAKNEKPDANDKIISGMVMGRIKKELKEICLLDQVYVKAEDGKQSVAQYVAQVAKENGAKITVKKFVRFETGEGIEKKEENFAEEVAKQMGQ